MERVARIFSIFSFLPPEPGPAGGETSPTMKSPSPLGFSEGRADGEDEKRFFVSMSSRAFPVTLVLVAFNKAEVIGKVIQSVASGTLVPDLLVVSDDGSTDGTPEAAREAAAQAGIPARILRHPRLGPYRLQTMRNSGVAAALDGMIFISDSDCLFGPRTLETHYAIHASHRPAVGTGPRFEFLRGTSGPFTSMYCTLEFSHFPRANYLVPYGANLSFKKSLWRLLGGFDRIYEGSYGLDDHEFCLRAEKLGARCVSDPGGYLIHCPHDTIFGGRRVLRNWDVFFDSFGLHIGEEEYWYVHYRVAPWYWRGNRKTPILGGDVPLNDWGAPEGFVPPLHLELSRSLAPLLGPLGEHLEGKKEREALLAQVRSVHPAFLPETSPAFSLVKDLQEALERKAGRMELEALLERYERLDPPASRTVKEEK